jgi:hypothetical protein
MADRLHLRAIYTLVDLRLAERFWDPELHPRVNAGTSKGGEFTFKGTGTTDVADSVMGGTEEPYDPTVAISTKGHIVKLDPETLEVGGDNWNKHVARRLEYEYKRTKPHLDKLVDEIVKGKVEPDIEPQHPDDEDVEGVTYNDEDEDVHYTAIRNTATGRRSAFGEALDPWSRRLTKRSATPTGMGTLSQSCSYHHWLSPHERCSAVQSRELPHAAGC